MFLLVPAYPGCPGSKAVKRSLLYCDKLHGQARRSNVDRRKYCQFTSTDDGLLYHSKRTPCQAVFTLAMAKFYKSRVCGDYAGLNREMCSYVDMQ